MGESQATALPLDLFYLPGQCGLMTTQVQKNIEFSKKWLSHYVYPLWGDRGVDKINGGFVESLSFDGEPLPLDRRAMVQARQIYSFLTGARLGSCPPNWAHQHVILGTKYLVDKFSLPSGAFRYSVQIDGTPKNDTPDLYTQAFALFGLAQEFSITKDPKTKERALALLKYLKRDRTVPGGGYTELDDQGNKFYRSNPHMHLFESAIAWMQIDPDPRWTELGNELINLCLEKFIDPKTGVIGEYFDASWHHKIESGRFVFEPGHQYEWAWLMSLFEDLTKKDLKDIRHRIFNLAEKFGTSPQRKVAFDEVWSDWTPKKTSSRFWPQCERIKAAVRLGSEVTKDAQGPYAKAADDALETLFRFFGTPVAGMWYDQLSENDAFSGDFSKSSSLYHIVNALEEYIILRPKILA